MTPEQKARQEIDKLLEIAGWGVQDFFRDLRDLYPRSRLVFAFHKPETLMECLSKGYTLRARLQQGEAVKFYNIFGENANRILEELNEVLAA